MTLRATNYAIIAGSGFESFAAGTAGQWLETPYGTPSAEIRQLAYGKCTVSYLARHGDGRHIPAHKVNYRANLAALERLGVSDVLAVNTVGVIRAGLVPGTLAVPAQLIDYTYGRDHSIYDENSATLDHVDFTRPFCDDLRSGLLQAGGAAGVTCFDGGIYAVTQGPRLETAAEIDRLERDGADFVGMTLMPEAVLSRELGIRFACLSLLVNHAAGRSEKGIYEDIETSMESARRRALRVLQAFFDNLT